MNGIKWEKNVLLAINCELGLYCIVWHELGLHCVVLHSAY